MDSIVVKGIEECFLAWDESDKRMGCKKEEFRSTSFKCGGFGGILWILDKGGKWVRIGLGVWMDGVTLDG